MIEIRNMKLSDAYILSKDLREGDRMECEAFGKTPKELLRKSYYESIFKKTTVVDGEIAACFGATGGVLGYTAYPWLLTSPKVEKCYLALALAYRQQVKEMLKLYPRLENYCLASYTKSLKLLKIVGFQLDEPEPYGINGVPFCKFYLGGK